MYKDKKILCLIPARGGSKRLPGKNIMLLGGRPLISYAIDAAKGSKYVDRTVVSTDDEAIARIAKECGAEIPFLRPAELSTDTSPVVLALQHAVTYFEGQDEQIDFVVLIQPTVPGVLAEDVDAAIEKIIETGVNSCISVCEIVDPPAWMYRMGEGGHVTPYVESDTTIRNQDLEKLYRVNGAVYVLLRSVLMEENKIIDQASCAAIIMPRERSVDIDTALDFTVAEALIKSSSQLLTDA